MLVFRKILRTCKWVIPHQLGKYRFKDGAPVSMDFVLPLLINSSC